jgi:septal ring factor EnvC (AmiA/AmiB activator)
MRSFLYVSELPKRAVTVAQQAIEDDSDFRSRVAAEATEESVGRAGFLWLHRPGGWAQEFEVLTSEDDDENLEMDAEPMEDATDPIDLRDAPEYEPPPEESIVEEPFSEPVAAEPDPELEEVYKGLLSRPPVELVNAQPPEPTEPDYSFDPGDTFSPESPPISEAPMASVSLIGGADDSDQPPPPFELASMGAAAVTDRASYDAPNDGNFTSFGEGDGVIVETSELDFEEDALENELSSLRGLVDRLAGEREMVVSNLPAEVPAGAAPVEPVVSESVLESEIMALESDLDNAHHELKLAKADLATARHDREEAQRLQSDALRRQVELEKELASVREQRVEIENQSSEAQVSVISLEDKLARVQSLLDEADRERQVIKSQLETMTSERNQLREDRVALKTERDDLQTRMSDIDEKTEGVEVSELMSSNKSMTTELDATSRELARMIAQAESLEEQISTTTANADTLKTTNVELSSRLADTDLALETTRTQHEALKADSDRLAAEVGTLRAERDGLQVQLTELQSSLAEVLNEQAESRQRNDSDRQALNELRIERDVLMARMNDLEQADRDYEVRINALVRERDDLMAARDDLVNERGQLRGEASASAVEKDQLVEKLFDVESKIGPLETELLAERRQREELANRLLELDDIADQNAAELARLTEERGSMSASIEELQAERVEVAEIRSERDQMLQELRNERDQITEQLQDSEQRLEAELASNERQVAELAEQLAAAEANRTSFEESAEATQTTLETQVSNLTSELDSLRYDSSEMTSELSRLRQTEEQTTTALAEAQATIESLSSEVQSAREARAEAETQLELSDQARNKLNDQLEAQTDLARVRATELEAAEARIAEAKVAEAEARIAAEVNAAAAEEAKTAADHAQIQAEEAKLKADEAQVKADEAQVKADEAQAHAKADEGISAAALAGSALMFEAEPAADADAKVDIDEDVTAPLEAPVVDTPLDGDAAADAMATADADTTTPEVDPGLEVGTGVVDGEIVNPGDTVSIDLTTLPKPADGLATPDVPTVTPLEPGPFSWPAPATESETTPETVDADVTSLINTSEDPSPVGDLTMPPLAGSDDEDDLDEVSELIAKTVSSFNDPDGATTPAPDALDDDFALDVPDTPAELTDPTTQVLPEFATAPPSIFAANADASPLDAPEADEVKEPSDPVARRSPGRKRRQIEVPSDIMDDEVAVAQFVVSSPDVVLLVDGDSVAKLGWPSYAVAQQRDALVTYLADLSASSGAAPDVVFDGRIGDDESLPASRAVRIRLSTPPTEPAAALDELVDAYPEQWPIALVTDDPELAASATDRGAAVLNNGQLLDLFISE